MGKKDKFWIQNAINPKKRGALHRQLEVPKKKKLPKTLLRKIRGMEIGSTARNPTKIGKRKVKVTKLLKKRATLALTLRDLNE